MPEDPSDHRGRLQSAFLAGRKEIDPRGEHRLNGVGNGEPGRQLAHGPSAAHLLENALIDQGRENLLDEEGATLRALEDEPAQGLGELAGDELVEQALRFFRTKRLEPDGRGVAAPASPGRTAVEKLGPRRDDEEERPAHIAQEPLEQLEQRILRPVKVLDDHDGGTLGDELVEELHTGGLQLIARGERMEVRYD